MTLLAAEGISKSFGGLHAVQAVSFRVADGEILGLIGPNGAGKTTLFHIISGFLPPDRGTIHYAG
jgi:branched-chain amino acid transport system ATP-binding protein